MSYNNTPNGISPGFGPNPPHDDAAKPPHQNGSSGNGAPGATPNPSINSHQQLSVFFPSGADSELESVLKPLIDGTHPGSPNPGNPNPGNPGNPGDPASPHNNGQYGQTVRQQAGPGPIPSSTPGVGPFPMGAEPDPQFQSGRLRPLQSITGTTSPLPTPTNGSLPIARATITGPLHGNLIPQSSPSPNGPMPGPAQHMGYSVTHNTGPFNAFTSPQLVQSLVTRILSGIPTTGVLERTPEIEQMLAGRFMSALSQVPGPVPANSQPILFRLVMDEILGLGPLEPFMQDSAVTEIMVNGPNQVWVERSGQTISSEVKFMNEDHLMRTAVRMASRMGRRLDRKWPILDGRLPDGSRVNIIGPPCALHGTSITIRKQTGVPLTINRLAELSTITPELADFLRVCVQGRLNILIAGGSSSGKTTLMNALASYIPEDERIVTVEESAELRLEQPHVVALETRPSEYDPLTGTLVSTSTGEVTLRHLVTNALRMRAQRILVGEIRGGEVLELVAAMNTGHDGLLATMHASTPRDAVAHLESMALMSGTNLAARSLREAVATAVDLIVQIARLRNGTRRVIYVTEVRGMEGDTIALKDIFRWHELVDEDTGSSGGFIEPTGHTPRFIYRLQDRGLKLDPAYFMS